MRQVDPLSGDGLLVVTPTFNERENLPSFLAGVLEAMPLAHVLVVDDDSPDGTGKLALEVSRLDPRVHVLSRAGKLGLGTAYVEGFGWALKRGYALIAEMDADLSHDPRDLPRLCTAVVVEGAALAVGSRNVPGGGVLGWGLGRHLLSKGGSFYARTVLGLDICDFTTGFKVYRRETLLAIDCSSLRSNGYAFQIETTYRVLARGLPVVEVPIVFTDRRVGASKMDLPILLEGVFEVWRLRFERR